MRECHNQKSLLEEAERYSSYVIFCHILNAKGSVSIKRTLKVPKGSSQKYNRISANRFGKNSAQ